MGMIKLMASYININEDWQNSESTEKPLKFQA